MRNFEKFEKEIKDADYQIGLTKDGKLMRCDNLDGYDCGHCIYNANCQCMMEVFKWLYEEYKEPLLTDAE